MSTAPRPVVWVCINGILNFPGSSEGWTDRAVTWLQTRTDAKAEKWEYAAGPLLRRIRQQSRAVKIAKMISYYQQSGFDVVLVGHSNGCDIIARVLELRLQPGYYFIHPVRSVHLVAPAADWSDFALAVRNGDVGKIHIYGSKNDRALRLARWSRRLFGWAGLGYGSLGLEGAARARDEVAQGFEQRVFDHSDDRRGHSDRWERGISFERTMLQLWRNDHIFGNQHP